MPGASIAAQASITQRRTEGGLTSLTIAARRRPLRRNVVSDVMRDAPMMIRTKREMRLITTIISCRMDDGPVQADQKPTRFHEQEADARRMSVRVPQPSN